MCVFQVMGLERHVSRMVASYLYVYVMSGGFVCYNGGICVLCVSSMV